MQTSPRLDQFCAEVESVGAREECTLVVAVFKLFNIPVSNHVFGLGLSPIPTGDCTKLTEKITLFERL